MEFDIGNVLLALALTAFAGLSTGLGGLFLFGRQKKSIRLLAGSLGFSAGVMIYISFVELLREAESYLGNFYGARQGQILTVVFFFAGIALIAVIDKIIPEADNPHEFPDEADLTAVTLATNRLVTAQAVQGSEDDLAGQAPLTADSGDVAATTAVSRGAHMKRTGILTAIAICVHNFPEGMATFIAALADPTLGISIAIAIAIHNIPEGLSVAVPIYFAGGSRRQALKYAFLSGLSEPLGALAAATFLLPFLNEGLLGILFAAVAGIMVYISLDELLPSAQNYGEHHLSIWGLILGMAVMAVSLLIL